MPDRNNPPAGYDRNGRAKRNELIRQINLAVPEDPAERKAWAMSQGLEDADYARVSIREP